MASNRPTVAWFCRGCANQEATDGDEPGECPVCGHENWKKMLDERDYAEVHDDE